MGINFDEIARNADQRIVNILLQFIAECQEKDAQTPMQSFFILTIYEDEDIKLAFKHGSIGNALTLLGAVQKATNLMSDFIPWGKAEPLT